MPDEEIPDEIQAEPIPLTPVARQERIAAMDVLRGLAVLGIFLINMPLYLAPLDAFFNWENNALWSDPADRLTTAFLYIFALRKIPVSVAFPSVSLSYALVAVLGHFLFGEPFGIKQIGGIALIMGGVVLINQT